jgi:hypothetical protein
MASKNADDGTFYDKGMNRLRLSVQFAKFHEKLFERNKSWFIKDR